MTWSLVLEGDEIDLSALETAYREMPEANVHLGTADDGARQYTLRSTLFDALNDHHEVYALSKQLLEKMHGALKLEFDAQKVKPSGIVYRYRPDGRRDVIAITPTLQFRLRGCAAEAIVGGQVRQRSLQERVVALSERDLNVSDALEHFSHSSEWFDIYKVLEVVRSDVGNGEAVKRKNWVAPAEFDFLWETANYYRHARGYRPARMVTHEEACSLLRTIMRHWIDEKLEPLQ